MIKPLEKYAEDKRSIRHIIYRLPSTPNGDYIDDILYHGNHTEIGGGEPLADGNHIAGEWRYLITRALLES